MKLRFCSCRACKRGRKSSWNQYMIIHKKRGARHQVKQMLKQGKWEDLPVAISIPYTD